MMTSTMKPSKPLPDVLYEFSIAQEVPDAQLLDEYTKLYPGYAAQLTEFAIEIALDVRRGPEEASHAFEEETVSPAVSRAMSAFQVALQETRGQQEVAAAEVSNAEVENPFASLDRKQFRALATAMDANTAFLCKLRDCLIDPQTMSDGFLQLLGDKLAVSVDLLRAFFEGKSPQLAGQHFKADKKPSVGGQQSFEDAVKSSGLTADQQQFLAKF